MHVESSFYLGAGQAGVLPHLLRKEHSLLGDGHVILAELRPLLRGHGTAGEEEN